MKLIDVLHDIAASTYVEVRTDGKNGVYGWPSELIDTLKPEILGATIEGIFAADAKIQIRVDRDFDEVAHWHDCYGDTEACEKCENAESPNCLYCRHSYDRDSQGFLHEQCYFSEK